MRYRVEGFSFLYVMLGS
ncbi:hypothetical protein [Fusobacterium hwasookii]